MRNAGNIVRTDEVEESLDVNRSTASKLLSRWSSQGYLRRVGPGIYAVAELGCMDLKMVLDHSWMIAPSLFDPGYIGGRTMTEYWDLTEQIFLDTVVYTGRPVRSRYQRHAGLRYTVKHIHPSKIFGLTHVWHENIKIAISDLPRTILDLLNEPVFGGGIQQVILCFGEYLRHECRQDEKLISYSERLGNGVIFKRLGFLAERMSDCTYLVDACKKRLTKGNAKLDPTVPSSQLVTKWRLWIPDLNLEYERDGY